MDPLVARIETPGMTAHGDQSRFALLLHHRLGVHQAVRQGDFHFHVLAGPEALQRLGGVDLGGRAENHGVHLGQCQAVGQVGGHMTDAILVGDGLGLLQHPSHQGNDLHAVDILDAVEMLDAERTGAGQRDLDGVTHEWSSRMRCPTAVLDAGT